MINYGVVYPQAILMFTITLLYSVVQPLILIFGAIYFGMAYMVYKYKLLFGEQISSVVGFLLTCILPSLLQTVRISGTSLAAHIHSVDMGCRHLSSFHDRLLPAPRSLHDRINPRYCPLLRSLVDLVHRQEVQAAERIRQLELSL